MYERYRDRADFWWIYIKEAHPSDGFRPASHVSIKQPTSFAGREEVAATCSEALKLTMPVLVDDMNNTVMEAYHAWPDRLFILNPEGRVVYRGDRGPRGFDVKGMEQRLAELLAAPVTGPADEMDPENRARG